MVATPHHACELVADGLPKLLGLIAGMSANCAVGFRLPAVLDPFPHVAVHVEQPQWISWQFTHRVRS